MSHEILLLLHPALGVLAILSAVWVFVETLNAQSGNLCRLRLASRLAALLVWLSYLIAGYWYVVHYGPDKAVIKAGPWPFAHNFFMETKEHLFFGLLLLACYLPIATSNDLVNSAPARRLVLLCAGLFILLGLDMEGSGAIVAMGTKMGLLLQ